MITATSRTTKCRPLAFVLCTRIKKADSAVKARVIAISAEEINASLLASDMDGFYIQEFSVISHQFLVSWVFKLL